MGNLKQLLDAIDVLIGQVASVLESVKQLPALVEQSVGSDEEPPQPIKAITTTGLNLRTGQGTSYSVIRTLAKGTTVFVRDPLEEKSIGKQEWIGVDTEQGERGFVLGTYLKKVSSTPTYEGFPPLGRSWVGVHGPADWEWPWWDVDFDNIDRARLDAVKFLSGPGFGVGDISRLRKINPRMFLVCRLYDRLDSPKSPDQFATYVLPFVKQYYAAGVRYFEVHNEPNLPYEGLGINWQNGGEFARWFMRVISLLRPHLPRAYFGFPGLSPSAPYSWKRFWDEALTAGIDPDWVGIHTYWTNSPQEGISFVRSFVQQCPWPVMVTEFSNPSPTVSKSIKGTQYVEFYRAMNTLDGVVASFSFLLGASGNAFAHETWRNSEIPAIIGRAREEGLLPFSDSFLADGFDSPVGTPVERASQKIWPGYWEDATGFASYYTAVGPAYHTGADLNCNWPSRDMDKRAPVYSPCNGVVTFSAPVGGTWGNIVVIRCDPTPSGEQVWARFAHIEDIQVSVGDRVSRGQQVARIGNSGGKLPYHLHFDLAKTGILERNPTHWPGINRAEVLDHYIDPAQFIATHRPQRWEVPFPMISVWHWKASSVSARTISDLVSTYKQFAPQAIQAFIIKTSDGSAWQANFDTSSPLSIHGPQSVQMWASSLQEEGYGLHIWAVPHGKDIFGEADRIIQAARVEGVLSVILDIEPFDGFWMGSERDVETLMTTLRQQLGRQHIGICVDPRKAHFKKIYPDKWLPFVDSIHPQCYWGTMRRQPKDVIYEAFEVWGSYGKPVCPVLQAYDVPTEELRSALEYAYFMGAPSMSLWRTGLIIPSVLFEVESWLKSFLA